MNPANHIIDQLDAYIDGALPADAQEAARRHLAACQDCQAAYESLLAHRAQIAVLPTSILPGRDLWQGIKTRIDALPQAEDAPMAEPAPDRRARPSQRVSARPGWASTRMLIGLSMVLIAIGWGAFTAFAPGDHAAWDVITLEGTPWIDKSTLAEAGRLREGQWLETDASSRATVDVGDIGHVEVAPKTRLQLQKADATDHRLVLEEGRIEAFIWAPPRLFFVETPAALAVDLGCAYTLEVDSTGTSLLHVTLGYVQLEHDGYESLIPAGAMGMARPGQGPGTAFDEEASEALRQALIRYDFENGGTAALSDILAIATATDAITLWQLVFKAEEAERSRIYHRLAELVTPPDGVTPEGVLASDLAMIERWKSLLGLEVPIWN